MEGIVMKFVTINVLIVAITLLAVPSLADTVVVPLPELTGDYEADSFTEPNFGHPYLRSLDLILPPGITGIDQLQLVLAGDWTVGEIICYDGEEPSFYPFTPALTVFITSDAFPGDFFVASVLPEGGAFTLTDAFGSCCPQGVLEFDQLLGVSLHVELLVDWALIGICSLVEDAYGSVDEVRLEIDGTVATQRDTWSAVRGLYR
jgi:hypothetical protein